MKYLVGNWIFDTDNEQLTCGDKITKPRLKVLQLLTCLLNNRGRVVTRDELIELIWDGNHLIGEKALNSVVYALRNILNGNNKQVNAIETIPKRGYRLTATVTQINENVVKRSSFLSGFIQHIALTRAAIMASLMVLSTASVEFCENPIETPAKSVITVAAVR